MNKQAALEHFRAIPEKRWTRWRYRVFGAGGRAFLAIPGGLRGILDAEAIDQVAILGASFGGSVAQVFVRRYPDRVRDLILSNTGVPLRRLAPAAGLTYWIAKVSAELLRKPLLRTVDPSGEDHAFWGGYLDELCSTRLTKADVLSNIRNQHDYYRCFRFGPEDLKDWGGRVLIAESDTDVIGPRRRKALRETYPRAIVHTFHNAGHAPLFTRYDEYLRMVREFLE